MGGQAIFPENGPVSRLGGTPKLYILKQGGPGP